MEDIKSGILSGVKIEKEKADMLANVADVENKLDNGVLDPEEIALGDMMGAGSSVKEDEDLGADVKAGDGSQVADHGLLTGVSISENDAEKLDQAAKLIEEVEAFEADGTKKTDETGTISDTLADAMGVK